MNNQYLNINFIRHLNAFYSLVHEHERLCANDISVYMALFQLWDLKHFPVPLMVNRNLVVRLCGRGMLRTCLQCLKRSNSLGILTYEPSERPFLQCMVKIMPLEKSDPHMWSNKDPAMGGDAASYPEDFGGYLHGSNTSFSNF